MASVSDGSEKLDVSILPLEALISIGRTQRDLSKSLPLLTLYEISLDVRETSDLREWEKWENGIDTVLRYLIFTKSARLSQLQIVERVMQHGANKYQRHGWAKKGGTSPFKCLQAAMRHLTAIALGQDVCEDSELPHKAHAIARLLMLKTLIQREPGILIENQNA